MKLRRMKHHLRGALSTSGRLRLWTGVPVGVGVTYAATRVMPDFASINSDLLYPLPYCAPAAVLGGLALLSKKTRRAGYGVLGGTAAYYLFAVVTNLQGVKSGEIAPAYKDESQTPPDQLKGAYRARVLRGARAAGGVQILR